MKLNSCYVCGTPIPELKIQGDLFSFRCEKCGCSTNYKSLFDAENDWNDGVIYPVSCEKCVHGDGTRKPCGKNFNKTPFAILCGNYKERRR